MIDFHPEDENKMIAHFAFEDKRFAINLHQNDAYKRMIPLFPDKNNTLKPSKPFLMQLNIIETIQTEEKQENEIKESKNSVSTPEFKVRYFPPGADEGFYLLCFSFLCLFF